MPAHDDELEWPKGVDPPKPVNRSFLMEAMARECRRRHWIGNELVPGLISLGFFAGWMLVFGRGTQWLERHASFDLLKYLRDELGDLAGIVAAMLMGPIGAIIATLFVSHALYAWRVKRTIARYQTRCVYCDYDLSDVFHDNEMHVCPECGHGVARLKARFHRWHVVQAEKA